LKSVKLKLKQLQQQQQQQQIACGRYQLCQANGVTRNVVAVEKETAPGVLLICIHKNRRKNRR